MDTFTDRWPDVVGVPRTHINAAIAAALVRRVAARLPVRIELPDRRCRAARPPGADGGPGGGRVAGARLNHPKAFFRRLGHGGLVGFGEAYQAGDWDADDLTGVLSVFAGAADRIVPPRCNGGTYTAHGSRAPSATLSTARSATSIATTTCPTCSPCSWTHR